MTVKELYIETGIAKNTLLTYEINNKMPSVSKLMKLANFFRVSVDFLLLWNETDYPKHIRMITLAEKIDKTDQVKRFQIESTAKSLLGEVSQGFHIKTDESVNIQLTTNFHNNLKLLRKNKDMRQAEIAEYLEITPGQVSFYEKNQIPSLDKLLFLSKFLNISVHALVTGQKLFFNFNNKDLLATILKADKFLSLEEIKFLIHLMQRIIENSDCKNS